MARIANRWVLSDEITDVGFTPRELLSGCDGIVIVWDIESKDAGPNEVIKVIEPTSTE
ncbi:hypothetical protein BGX34_010114 [Mortierella sp. NVP85]|nr:hypothetical protein BGX34_010114 [Mortierella sp. NVP85]